jgi:hypothetical protein
MLVGMARAITKCPKCGEPVSPFAAGCTICGTDLEAARAQLAAKRGQRPQVPGIRVSDDGLRIGVGVLAALFSPVMGALLTGYFAYDADRDGRIRLRNLMLVLLGFSLVGVFAYAQLWGGIFFGI